jgi:ATP-binding cassette subfamily F protein 3
MKAEQDGILERMRGLPEGASESSKLLERYGELETCFRSLGGYSMESKIMSVLHGLGFQDLDRTRPTETFSGGWQMRIALAKLLLAEHRILLLDEPTDHLDLDARNWLVEYLKAYTGALFVVSHDRYFLDMVVIKVMELLNKKLDVYYGNYSDFLQEKSKRMVAFHEAYLREKGEIQRIQAFIEKNRSRKDRARQVQSRIRQLEKMELVKAPVKERQIRFHFPSPTRSARRQIELVGIEKSYGDRTIFRGLDLVLERGERIGVVGPNGAGKSTLLRILGGMEPFQKGFRHAGSGASIGYFCQDQISSMDSTATVLEDLIHSAPRFPVERLRTLLGCFLFRGEEVFKKLPILSGGERTRLTLAKLLLKEHNILLLDEPTNHLDLASKEVLLEALLSSACTLVFVSHDRYFVNQLATRILEVGQGTVRSYLGNYEDYYAAVHKGVEDKGMRIPSMIQPQQGNRHEDAGLAKKERIQIREKQKEQLKEERRRVRRIQTLEMEIDHLEKQIMVLDSEMTKPEVSTDFVRLHKLYEEKEALEERLDHCLKEWGQLKE